MPTDRVAVDTEALARTGHMAGLAATTVGSLRAEVMQIVTSPTAVNAFGNDSMGREMAAKYQPSANAMVQAVGDVEKAFGVMRDRLLAMAGNYETTEAENAAQAARFGSAVDEPHGGADPGGGKRS